MRSPTPRSDVRFSWTLVYIRCTIFLVVLFYVFAICLESFLLYFNPKLRERPASIIDRGDFFYEIMWPILFIDVPLLASSFWALLSLRPLAVSFPLYATVPELFLIALLNVLVWGEGYVGWDFVAQHTEDSASVRFPTYPRYFSLLSLPVVVFCCWKGYALRSCHQQLVELECRQKHHISLVSNGRPSVSLCSSTHRLVHENPDAVVLRLHNSPNS